MQKNSNSKPEALKIFVSENIMLGVLSSAKKKPIVVKSFPLFKEVLEVLNIVFLGRNTSAIPPTFCNINKNNLKASFS
jgi:hypothetical protein